VGLEGARKLKEKANQEFLAERYDQALLIYVKAISITPEEEKQDIAIFHNNRGLCYTKLVSIPQTLSFPIEKD